MKTLVLTEKREAAVQMASVIGDAGFNKSYDALDRESKSNGFLEGANYVFSWAAGHLFREKKPSEIRDEWGLYQKLSSPEEYKLEELTESITKIPDNDSPHKKKQRMAVKRQLDRDDIEKIIIATDADAEGEAIGRDLIFQLKPNIDKPIMRFWNTGSFKSEEAVKKAMDNLKPYNDDVYENLYASQQARSTCDYITGMKPTKVAVDYYNKKFYTGRVKAVIVSLVGDRILEIQNFKPSKYYQIIGKKGLLDLSHFYYKEIEDFDDNGNEIIKKEKTKNYLKKEDVENAVKEMGEAGLQGIVKKNEIKQVVSKTRPLPLSGSDFASEMMGKYKISYSQCNDILDYLRTEGFTTYPGTNGRYFSTMDKEEVEIALNAAKEYFGIEKAEFTTNCGMFNNKKAEKQNHTPLSITGKLPTEQDLRKWENHKLPKLKEAFELIAKRIAVWFLEDDLLEKQHLIISLKDGKYKFEATGQKAIKQGWRSFIGMEIKDTTFQADTPLKEGDTVKLDSLQIKESLTKAPPKLTTKTLLDTLLNVTRVFDKMIEDTDDHQLQKKYKKMKKMLKSAEGIGTDRTRETMINDLFKNDILRKENKTEYLNLTETGWEFYHVLPEKLKSVIFTAEWENSFEKIRRGEETKEDLIQRVDNLLMEEIIPEMISSVGKKVKPLIKRKELDTKCPLCGNPIVEVEKAYLCSNIKKENGKFTGCKFVLFKNLEKTFGRTLSGEEDLKKFLNTRYDEKEGEPDVSKVWVEENHGIYFTPNRDNLMSIKWINKIVPICKCPLCKEGDIIERGAVFVCSKSEYKKDKDGKVHNSGCKFIIFKSQLSKLGGAPIKSNQVKTIVEKGQVKVKLMSKAGHPYEANLTLNIEPKEKEGYLKIVMIPRETKEVGTCPICQAKLLDNGKAYVCENNKLKKDEETGNFIQTGTCNYRLRKNALEKFGKKTISEKEVKDLVANGEFIATLKGKNGSYKKYIRVDEKWGVAVDFEREV